MWGMLSGFIIGFVAGIIGGIAVLSYCVITKRMEDETK
jgi:hypothetical protein